MSKNQIEKLLSFLITLVIIFYYYSELLLHPNAHLTADWGDGIKAFYVFMDHIKNDASYHQLSNMTYPYGQTHIFTDGQTIIAIIFKYLSHISTFFLNNAIAIYNLLILFSFPFCALLLCAIIQRLRMPLLFTILGSVLLSLMSPQIFRMLGHPTLSYVCFFPLCWWLFIRFHESTDRKTAWSVLIAINSAFWCLVHPYYIMIASFFYGSYFLVEIVQSKTKFKQFKKIIIPFTFQIALPLLVTRLYIAIVDLHQFRSASPWGFWDAYASWNTVFMPNHEPFNATYKYFFPDTSQHWEGWAYIGLPAVFIALFSLLKIARYLFRKKYNLILKPVLPIILKQAVWASFLVLLFSMCLPFQLGMRFLVDWLSFLKQFRSLGRFAWVFYYVFTVYGLYITWLCFRFLKIRKLSLLAYTLATTYFTIYAVEVAAFHKDVSQNAIKGINYFSYKYIPEEYYKLCSEIDKIKHQYQCIIPLPFYLVGSENFGVEPPGISMQTSMIASYWCNMPMMAGSAARSPILESKKIMQFFSPSYFKKDIESELHSKKPFLILYTKEDLSDRQLFWLHESTKIYSGDKFELWSLPYEKVFHSKAYSENNNHASFKDSLAFINGYFTNISKTLIYIDFDSSRSDITFKGSPVFQGVKKNYNVLLPKGNYPLLNDRDYILSFWYYNDGELRNQNYGVIEECNREGNDCKWDISFGPGESMIIDGNWSLIEKRFRLKNNDGQISVFLKGDDYSDQKIYIDDLLIRESNIDILPY